MNKTAIAFSTKDRVELSRQSIEPLLQPDKFDLFWIDGSSTDEGEAFVFNEGRPAKEIHMHIRGGADAAIVYSLTTLLNHPNNYDYIGLVENDVLLHPAWFGPTMALFERGKADGLEVGAVSARCFEDRILFQREGYAVVHNSGAGMVIFTRQAARHVLTSFRTSFTTENRKVFAQVSGLDIGKWWAFRGGVHPLTADWGFEVTLARHGLASLALTPSPVEMIGQIPPLHEQGLKLVTEPVELLRNDGQFDHFVDNLANIRLGYFSLESDVFQRDVQGYHIIFPHQFPYIHGPRSRDWKLKWMQGFGPFAYQSKTDCEVFANIYGPCSFILAGSPSGGRARISDASGYSTGEMFLPPQQQITVGIPTQFEQQWVTLEVLDPDVLFLGLVVGEKQAINPRYQFDHSTLPPVE